MVESGNFTFADLLQLAASLWITSFDDSCNTSVDHLQKTCCQQAVASHPIVDQVFCKMSTDLLQLARFASVGGGVPVET